MGKTTEERYEDCLQDAHYYERRKEYKSAISALSRARNYTNDAEEIHHLELWKKRLEGLDNAD